MQNDDAQKASADSESLHAPLIPATATDDKKTVPDTVVECWWNSCTYVALTGACIGAGSALSFKELSTHVSPFQIVGFRSLIAMSVLLPVGYWQTGYILGPLDNFLIVLIRGFFAGVDFCCVGIAYNYVPLSEASLLVNCHPVFVAILQWCLRMDTFDLWTATGVLGTFAGQIFIAQPPFIFGGEQEHWDSERIIGIVCALMASLSRSIGLLLVTRIDKKVPSIIIANYAAFATILVSSPFLSFGFPEVFNASPSIADVLLYIGASADFLNQILVVRSFQIGPAVKAAVLSLSRALMMMALGIIVLSERFTFFHLVGAAIMLASIMLVLTRKKVKSVNFRTMRTYERLSDCRISLRSDLV